MTKLILSLFDYTGNWSRPYKENGYDVVQIDIKLGYDILEWDYTHLTDVYGILAAVPCTAFAVSGARWFKDKDADGTTDYYVSLLDRTLEIIEYHNPVFWAIENPVGRIARFAELPKPFYFQPCDYGDPYTKKTGLWGKFQAPVGLMAGPYWNPVEPTEGSKMHLMPPGEKRNELRSVTPMGFAWAFYHANQ